MFNLYDFCDLQNVGIGHDRIPVKSLLCVLANTVPDKNMLMFVQKYLRCCEAHFCIIHCTELKIHGWVFICFKVYLDTCSSFLSLNS